MGTIRIFLLPRIYGSDQLINHTLNYRVLSLPFIQVFHYNSARVLFISKALNHITNKKLLWKFLYCDQKWELTPWSRSSHIKNYFKNTLKSWLFFFTRIERFKLVKLISNQSLIAQMRLRTSNESKFFSINHFSMVDAMIK